MTKLPFNVLLIALICSSYSNSFQGYNEPHTSEKMLPSQHVQCFRGMNQAGDYFLSDKDWTVEDGNNPWDDKIRSIFIPDNWVIEVRADPNYQGDGKILYGPWDGGSPWSYNISSFQVLSKKIVKTLKNPEPTITDAGVWVFDYFGTDITIRMDAKHEHHGWSKDEVHWTLSVVAMEQQEQNPRPAYVKRMELQSNMIGSPNNSVHHPAIQPQIFRDKHTASLHWTTGPHRHVNGLVRMVMTGSGNRDIVLIFDGALINFDSETTAPSGGTPSKPKMKENKKYYSVRKEDENIIVTVENPIYIRHHATSLYAPYIDHWYIKGQEIKVKPNQWLTAKIDNKWTFLSAADNR